MRVYFTNSTSEFKKYSKNYYAIRNFLVAEKHILTRDWLHLASERIAQNNVELEDVKQIYKECVKAIQQADCVIIEDTVSNFSTGHQITLSLQWQKPTLVLWCMPKHRHFKNTFIQGIESEFLEVHEYSLNNYKEIIRAFLKKYENANQKNRFHLVLSEVERKYLDWAQYNKHKSRTNLIRKAINQMIDSDKEYTKYLEAKIVK